MSDRSIRPSGGNPRLPFEPYRFIHPLEVLSSDHDADNVAAAAGVQSVLSSDDEADVDFLTVAGGTDWWPPVWLYGNPWLDICSSSVSQNAEAAVFRQELLGKLHTRPSDDQQHALAGPADVVTLLSWAPRFLKRMQQLRKPTVKC